MDIDVNGTGYSSAFDYGNGTYDISVNCSETVFDGYGWFAIRINASKTLFVNQSKILVIKITGENSIKITNPANYSTHYDTDIFNITVYFNDTAKNQPITSATIDIDVNGTGYSSAFDYGNGYYNITVDCSDPIFGALGWFGIRINLMRLNKTITIKVNN
jgi:hypothetical protein